jgi:hypothetical protein
MTPKIRERQLKPRRLSPQFISEVLFLRHINLLLFPMMSRQRDTDTPRSVRATDLEILFRPPSELTAILGAVGD